MKTPYTALMNMQNISLMLDNMELVNFEKNLNKIFSPKVKPQ